MEASFGDQTDHGLEITEAGVRWPGLGLKPLEALARDRLILQLLSIFFFSRLSPCTITCVLLYTCTYLAVLVSSSPPLPPRFTPRMALRLVLGPLVSSDATLLLLLCWNYGSAKPCSGQLYAAELETRGLESGLELDCNWNATSKSILVLPRKRFGSDNPPLSPFRYLAW